MTIEAAQGAGGVKDEVAEKPYLLPIPEPPVNALASELQGTLIVPDEELEG